jgi:hypothetical protein
MLFYSTYSFQEWLAFERKISSQKLDVASLGMIRKSLMGSTATLQNPGA